MRECLGEICSFLASLKFRAIVWLVKAGGEQGDSFKEGHSWSGTQKDKVGKMVSQNLTVHIELFFF